MKEKINKICLTASMVTGLICFTGCSDDFLKDKKVYGSYDASVVYENYETAKSRVDFLYQSLLPSSTGGSNALTDITSAGIDDDFSKCTEEYGDYSIFNDPTASLTIQTVPDYFYVINSERSPWGRIRECNNVIEGVTGSATLSQTEKEQLLGQAYFFRAWRYYLLVKMYGGVPIVDHVQNPVIGDGNGENLVIPRSSTKACIDFICDDLELAASYLPARWQNEGQDYGRITTGAALALKGRTLLLYASPLFNRADDASRWKDAYDANFAAITKLNEGNFGLAYEGNGGEDNAKNWARMFATYTGGSEAVFVTLYNNVSPIASQNINRYNLWEQGIRPGNINGGGGKTPTAEIIDIFPMIDGKKPMESGVHYDPKKFFLNRDPRFYRTFAFPGVEWKFNSGNVDFSGATMSGLCPTRYTSGANYELWNYCWYTTADERNNPSRSGFAADMLGTKNRGVYVRKRSDDFDLGTSLYVFTDNSSGDQQGFRRSAAPYMEIRYAEVLLNLAESACGAGGTYHAEGVKALKAVRGRVGYTSANNYGLDAAIETDRAKLFEAILYERQVELAFEGKRAYDMRRWMLFDGGVGQGALNASWALSGFGGNTCTYLGVTPMNERGKRYRIEINVEGTGSANNDSDPIKNVERPAALTLNEKIATEADGETILDPAVSSICTFYDTYFSRKDISLDGNVLDINPYFQPRYYFFGLRQSAQQTNATLYQTIGWEDYAHGGMGTFDPLAE